MSTSPASVPVQNPLGLPRGSVRGILSLMITGLFWLLLFLPEGNRPIVIPLNHYFLLSLVLLFFVTRSYPEERVRVSEADGYPFYITLIRLVIVGGTIAVVIYQYLNHHERFFQRITPTSEQMKDWPSYFMAMVLGFGLGYLFQLVPTHNHWMVQAVKAWISIIAMFSFVAEILIQAFIRPNLAESVDLLAWQTIVTGLVAFYFGARS